jgi:ABC-type multidrug transport system ATPase subunit
MHVSAKNLQKKYNGDIVFSNLDVNIPFGSKCAIIGPNGSGKSTLVQILAGFTLPSAGKVAYVHRNKEIDPDQWYSFISFCGPYQELIEEFTAKEIFELHFSLKKLQPYITIHTFQNLVSMESDMLKPIKNFSTGMKQKIKLGLAFCSDTPLLFLDEPTSNLDKANFEWFHSMVNEYTHNRTLIISSNQTNEYTFCDTIINVMDYK